MTEIKIGGRTIPLLYSTFELLEIQKAIGCTGFQLKEEVFGIRLKDEDDPMSITFDIVKEPEKIGKMATLIRIMGNAGLEESGQETDLTEKWIMRKMKPVMILPYAVAILNEIMEGNQMESPEAEKGDGPRDLGLEEEIGKKQQGN